MSLQISQGEYTLFSANIFGGLRAFIESLEFHQIFCTFHLPILKISNLDLEFNY
jgi:hypothetical protein